MSDNLQTSSNPSEAEREYLEAVEVEDKAEAKIVSSSEPSTDPVAHFPSVKLTAEIFATGTIPAGTMLGHFMVNNYIGGGGMGRVYLATDTLLDRKVAVKVLPHQRASDQSTVARFMNEAKSAARLNHEHIAQVYFAGEQDGVPFIVFEYVEGTNIRKMINESGVFSLPQALNYMLQIIHALAHAAENGVVHRDVKPSNILVTREGRAKLIDMGLARLLNPSDGVGDLTASGVTLGTFDYISPEQARDPRNADIRSDIYSLGCTFFFMLAGRPPFPEGTVLQKLLQHQGDLPPDIREIQPNIPAEVAMLIQKMMAKDPRQRFQTPEVLVTTLTAIARKMGMQPISPGNLLWTMQTKKKLPFFLKHAIWSSAFAILLGIFALVNILGNRTGQLELPKFPEPLISSSVNKKNTDNTPATKTESKETTKKDFMSQFVAKDVIGLDRALRLQYPILGTMLLGNTGDNKSDDFSLRLFDKNQFGVRIAPASVNAAVLPEAYISASIRTKDSATEQQTTNTESAAAKLVRRTLLRVDPSFDARFESDFPVDGTDSVSGRIRTYTNLKSAIEAADDNSIIELRWNEFLVSEPFSISDQSIRFVAAEGYRPVILFEPARAAGTAPSRSMITVNSCEIEFLDVSIEMRISQDVLASRWTLFDLVGGNKLEFSRAAITIANATANFTPYHQDVVFFRSSQLPRRFDGTQFVTDWGIGGGFFNRTNSDIWRFDNTIIERFIPNRTIATEQIDNQNQHELTNQLGIKLSNSIIRGEATVLQNEVLSEIDFNAKQSIIVTAKPFIQVEDNKQINSAKPTQITFDRVTFAGSQPFIRLLTNNDTDPTRFDCNMQSSLFVLNNTPLFEFTGKNIQDKINSTFKWNGNRNDFQNVSLAWQTKPANTTNEVNQNYAEYSLSDWVKRFDIEAGINRLFLPEFRKPMYQLQSHDLIPELPTPNQSRPPAGWTKNY